LQKIIVIHITMLKKNDIRLIIVSLILIAPLFLFSEVFDFVKVQNREHGMIFSFIKFAILATLGESIGLRIRTGEYNNSSFGLIQRGIVWGLLGLGIKMAFVVFAKGTPIFLEYMGLKDSIVSLNGDFTIKKLAVSFSVSVLLNVIFAPVMMALHKITDMHIERGGGTMREFLKPIQAGEIIQTIKWKGFWDFVIKKTIPFFWIPAHTITFLLPEDVQVLFAAVLGIFLGIFLSIANLSPKK